MIGELSRPIIHKLNKSYSHNEVYMMREDLLPLAFGGNKMRKAMYFLQDLREKGADYLVSYGSASSNHVRAMAFIAGLEGLPCLIISPSQAEEVTINKKLAQFMGVQYSYCELAEVQGTIAKTQDNLRNQGYKPYFVEGGGHGDLGTQAYYDAYKGIKAFELENKIYFDYIFLPSGTGSTQAGLIAGSFLEGDDRPVVGISIARKNPRGGAVVKASVESFIKGALNQEPLFIDDYILDGYASYNQAIVDTIGEVFTKEGVALDRVYTGKAFWAMGQYLKDRKISSKKILFINTGGNPLFFDSLDLLLDRSVF